MIDAIGPSVNPAGKVPHMVKTRLAQHLHCFCAARAHFADSDNVPVHVEFVKPLRQFRERDQLPADVGDFVLELIAYIKQKEILSSIQPLFQFFDANFRRRYLGPIR